MLRMPVPPAAGTHTPAASYRTIHVQEATMAGRGGSRKGVARSSCLKHLGHRVRVVKRSLACTSAGPLSMLESSVQARSSFLAFWRAAASLLSCLTCCSRISVESYT